MQLKIKISVLNSIYNTVNKYSINIKNNSLQVLMLKYPF